MKLVLKHRPLCRRKREGDCGTMKYERRTMN